TNPTPAVAVTPVGHAIVHPVRAALPELELFGQHAIAAPPRRARDALAVRRARHLVARFEGVAAVDLPALLRRVDAPPAFEWPAGEVGIRLGGGHLLHRAGNAHLPLERGPVEQERGAAGLADLARLAALVVGVEDEAAGVD